MSPQHQQQQPTVRPVGYSTPAAPPASPVLPPVDQLDPTFVPAQVMSPHDHLLPEKLLTLAGEPAARVSHPRPALADMAPHPLLPAVAPSLVPGATEFTSVSHAAPRPLIRTSSAHVFVNLAQPAPPATDWQVRPALEAAEMEAPLLPAPLDAMMSAGEGYIIKEADSGRVLAAHTDIVPPSLVSTADRH